ncbi:MAG: SH3 domain-containing protein [Oscillospiraceae bacterium]|nr:SH3 domain-containing protein [Oscillospiraceae bacterium]
MKIIHAVSNELGRSTGGALGDQTGEEIRKADWYNRPWEVYIECTDPYLADKAATIAEKIAKGNFGYSQSARWSGYKAIQKVGGADHISEAASGDFDCSSLVLSCYILAGLDIKATGYTGSMEKILLKTGKFVAYRDAEHVSTCKKAIRGGIYLMPNKHVIICIPAAKKDAEPSDLPEEYIEINYGTVYLRDEPSKDGKKLGVARKGDKFPYIGTENGWFETAYKGKQAFITSNFRYTKLHTI